MDSARALFDQLSNHEAIERLKGTVETPFIDFKRKANLQVPGASRKDREALSVAASGFANTGGGVIVWGVDCRPKAGQADRVLELQKIPMVSRLVTDLAHYAHQATDPPVEGIDVKKVLILPESDDMGFVVAFVPSSERRPHRSLPNNLYHLRIGESFPIMPHSVLVDMVNRRRTPDAGARFAYSLLREENGKHTYELTITITNRGPVCGRSWLMQVCLPHYVSPALHLHDGTCWETSEDDGVRFTWTGLGERFPLFPTLNIILAPNIEYTVGDENYELVMNGSLKWELYVDDMLPAQGTKPLRELQRY